jgi:hypothetical protein
MPPGRKRSFVRALLDGTLDGTLDWAVSFYVVLWAILIRHRALLLGVDADTRF